jgi:hypothetical protein
MLYLLAMEPEYTKNPKGGRVYLFRGPDATEKTCWVFFHVWKRSLVEFNEACKKGQMNPSDYGEAIVSGEGENPPESTIQRMRDDWGFLG